MSKILTAEPPLFKFFFSIFAKFDRFYNYSREETLSLQERVKGTVTYAGLEHFST